MSAVEGQIGWYGTISGLPAFTVATVGFTLFVGVLTDRLRSICPSVIAQSGWNGLVATSFAATGSAGSIPACAGSKALLGEFGWLAAVTMLVLGLVTALWHNRHPRPHPPRKARLGGDRRDARNCQTNRGRLAG